MKRSILGQVALSGSWSSHQSGTQGLSAYWCAVELEVMLVTSLSMSITCVKPVYTGVHSCTFPPLFISPFN